MIIGALLIKYKMNLVAKGTIQVEKSAAKIGSSIVDAHKQKAIKMQ